MDRIERCEKTFKELFDAMPTKDEGSDPEFMRILQRFIFGEVCYVGNLDNSVRELITVTVLSVYSALPQLTAHVKAALHVGCAPIQIREAVYQCAPFIGFPKTLNAISAMNKAFEESGINLPLENTATVDESNRYEKGLEIQAPIYGTEIADRYAYLPREFSEAIPTFLTELGFGDFATRKGLDEKLRELLTLVMLVALGGAEMQVKAHAIGALKVGNTKEDILAALVHAMPYTGFPRVLNALNAIKDVIAPNTIND